MPKNNVSAWYPKILVFDNDMNLLDSVSMHSSRDSYKISLPIATRHILITDNYNASILRNGISVEFDPN